jgi:plastocyanin
VKTNRIALFVLAVAVVTAGAAHAAEMASYQLTIKDHRFQPERVEIPAGQKVKLVIKNEDPTAEEFESSDLNREKVVPAGKTLEVFIGPLKTGTYGFFGDFHPDTAKGQIVVK